MFFFNWLNFLFMKSEILIIKKYDVFSDNVLGIDFVDLEIKKCRDCNSLYLDTL